MYTGNNPSALRSRDEIIQAFFHLLEEKPMEAIKINELMEMTQLARQTFYKIFKDKDEILECYLDSVFTKFTAQAGQTTIRNLCDAAKLFFQFFQQYEHPFSLIIQNGKSCVMQRKCREYLLTSQLITCQFQGAHTPDEEELAVIFVISGMVSMLEVWVRTPRLHKNTPDEMASLVCRLTGMDTGEGAAD